MKHVILTGGSRGLGLAFVERLLDDGYRVSTCSREISSRLEGLVASHPEFLRWSPCRVGEAQEVAAFIDEAVAWAGRESLWGLVNNAGVAREGILPTFPDVEIERILQVNLLGAIQATRSFLRHVALSKRPARIVNVSSIVGLRGYNGLSAYSASKSGLDGLTRALAREWGRTGTTVNSIAPGYLDTEMSSRLRAEERARIVRRTPLGRLGNSADVVPLLTFLLSEEAGFVTGQTLVVDGGVSS